jgi:ribosomal protein L15
MMLSVFVVQAIRWGRGNGSDRGTYCGRGIKGQKARKGAQQVSAYSFVALFFIHG